MLLGLKPMTLMAIVVLPLTALRPLQCASYCGNEDNPVNQQARKRDWKR